MSTVEPFVECAGCGRKSPWKAAYAGKRLRCKCGQVIEVRAAPVETADDDGPEIIEEPSLRGVTPHRIPVAPDVPLPTSPVSTVAAPPNPFDEPEAASIPLAPSAEEPPAAPPDDRVSDPDDYGSYGIAPMAAIPITRRPEPAVAYNPAEDDDDDDDLLPARPSRGGAAGVSMMSGPMTPVLGYNAARRRRATDDEQEQIASYQKKEMVLPAILIAVGLLATFVQARIDLGRFDILAMCVYVAVATVINLVLIFAALLIAAKLLDLGLGEVGPALLKIAAVAILPSAIGGMIQASVGFIGGMLAWVVTLGLLYLLLSWLFEMDAQEMMITAVIIWFMRTWVAYFVIMAIFSGGSDDSSTANTNAGGGNTPWVAPAGGGGTGSTPAPSGDGTDPGDGTTPPDDGTTPPAAKPPQDGTTPPETPPGE
ncbi:hypothetical protein [Humisphaera borealis]|uniref:Yip1 domain-containing protein n=1 Tax=Humisphaera borealis TaxID=2807512 RepID=A0A7M2WSH9_9BACT|nr:hypothetical protein [Humisphaera borealis]QOV88393.1 hypothetical protein IPV69_19370 [Humisphaera borealis]